MVDILVLGCRVLSMLVLVYGGYLSVNHLLFGRGSARPKPDPAREDEAALLRHVHFDA